MQIETPQTDQSCLTAQEYKRPTTRQLLKQEFDSALNKVVKLQMALSLLERNPKFEATLEQFDDLRYNCG